MLALRRVWTVLAGAWLCAALVRLVLNWILGFEGMWVGALVIAAAVAGGIAGVVEAHRIGPLASSDWRDGVLGWGAFIGAVGAVACLTLPLPWGPVAALVVVVLTVVAMRLAPPDDPSAARGSR